jgi:hypothetical protein
MIDVTKVFNFKVLSCFLFLSDIPIGSVRKCRFVFFLFEKISLCIHRKVFFICRVVAPLVRSVDLLASGARPSYLYVFRSDATLVSSTNNKPRYNVYTV